MRSCLYVGSVQHRRHRPQQDTFRYSLFMAYLDLDELDALQQTLRPFSVNQKNLWTFFDSDHFNGESGSTRDKIRRLLSHHNIDIMGGRIGLLTQCRLFGYVFNPISLYYCWNTNAELAAIVVEVRNTFGEQHLYILDHADKPQGTTAHFQTTKQMHVSPFISMDGTYDFSFTPLGEQLSVTIVQQQQGTRLLDAQLQGVRTAITNRNVMKLIAQYPFVTFKTMSAIHWEAARLYLKGVPFIPHPGKTKDQVRQSALLETLQAKSDNPGEHSRVYSSHRN